MIKKIYYNIKNKISYLKYDLACNNNGMGTIEIVLIIIVILGILVIFRDNIESLINSVFGKIHSQVNSF